MFAKCRALSQNRWEFILVKSEASVVYIKYVCLLWIYAPSCSFFIAEADEVYDRAGRDHRMTKRDGVSSSFLSVCFCFWGAKISCWVWNTRSCRDTYMASYLPSNSELGYAHERCLFLFLHLKTQIGTVRTTSLYHSSNYEKKKFITVPITSSCK